MTDISSLLPPSLKLPPNLSAHKYFFVCSLTVAAWDTLVLSPRTWKLARTKEIPPLKIIYHFIRLFMPIEFIIVAVEFFDTAWSQEDCQKSYLFEPIATAILLALCSAAHVIRVYAIHDKSKAVLALMGSLWFVQIIVTVVTCAFYRSVPLDVGQGCIAGPKSKWVGIYWVAPTLLYTVSFGLAIARSLKSLEVKSLSLWKLMLRDGLNLYGAIWVVNMTNVLFWFIMKPTANVTDTLTGVTTADTITTIVTSMAAVLTTTMTMRIILSVRGSLASGGSFAGTSAGSHSGTSGSRNTHGLRTNPTATANSVLNINANPNHTFTVSGIGSQGKVDDAWMGGDGKSLDGKPENLYPEPAVEHPNNGLDVKITVESETDYDARYGNNDFAREK